MTEQVTNRATSEGQDSLPPDVFLSYKREDEARIEPLVRALEGAGFRVWWDRSLPGATGWRAEINRHLAAARCVVVAWSEDSLGSDFVNDEAEAGRSESRLVPVCIDKVVPPIGFRQQQSLDMVGWQGKPEDPRFEDLRSTIAAVIERQPPPPLRWPRVRLRRRIGWVSLASSASAVLMLLANLANAQTVVCQAPGIHAVCASFGLGGVPTPDEQAAFDAALQLDDGSGLRELLARRPEGVLAERAKNLLQSCRDVDVEEKSEALMGPLAFGVGTPEARFKTEAEARVDVHHRFKADSDASGCLGYSNDPYQLREVVVDDALTKVNCIGPPVLSTWGCSAEGSVKCRVDRKTTRTREVCPWAAAK